MALKTAGDLIAFALRAGGIVGVGQTPAAEDSNDGLTMLNMLLSEWQVNRWLVPDLTEAFVVATGAASYTVGAAGAFVLSYGGARPERIDGAFARLISTGADTALFPFISKQGYDRVAAKTAVGPPESYFYDAQQGASGVVYFTPVPPATWELHVQAKASLGQFAGLTAPLSTLPPAYIPALMWNLAANIRPIYGKPDDPSVSARAGALLLAIANGGAQQAQAQQPAPSQRAGVFSRVVPPQPAQAPPQ